MKYIDWRHNVSRTCGLRAECHRTYWLRMECCIGGIGRGLWMSQGPIDWAWNVAADILTKDGMSHGQVIPAPELSFIGPMRQMVWQADGLVPYSGWPCPLYSMYEYIYAVQLCINMHAYRVLQCLYLAVAECKPNCMDKVWQCQFKFILISSLAQQVLLFIDQIHRLH
jgi:hypothetical protein